MKIIGHTGPDYNHPRYLVELDGEELAQLCGERWHSALMSSRKRLLPSSNEHVVPVGATLAIGAAWKLMENIRDREAELATLGEKLKDLGRLIGDAWPALTAQFPTAPKDG